MMYKKRFSLLLVLLVSCFLVLPLAGHQHHKKGDNYRYHEDGSITVAGLTFKNKAEYVRSEYYSRNGKRCGTMDRYKDRGLPDEPLGSQSDCSMIRTSIQNEYYPSVVYTIPLVFHVIYHSNGTGNLTDQQIEDQVQVLNEDYRAMAGTDGSQGFDVMIQFEIESVDRTQNNAWFNSDYDSSSEHNAMHSALGWNTSKYVNIYTVNFTDDLLGFASLPQYSAGTDEDYIFMLYNTIDGRDNAFYPYDQGRTLVHEMGHFLGLLHTFEGACGNTYYTGDLIVDTNAELNPGSGCTQTNSCGSPDPIHNYMDYTFDSCMYEFTEEQGNRMVCSLVNYRGDMYGTGSSGLSLTAPNGGESWTAGDKENITWTSSSRLGGVSAITNVKLEYSTNNGGSYKTIKSSTSNDGSYSWTVPSVSSGNCLVRISDTGSSGASDTSDSTFTISEGGGGSGTIAVNRVLIYYVAIASGAYTGTQTFNITAGSGSLAWTVSDDVPWLSTSPTSGSGSWPISVSVDPSGLSTGTYTGTVTVSSTNATNSPKTVTVTLTVKSAAQDQAPFGDLAIPASGSTVSSSVPISGWVLDDVGVSGVNIVLGTRVSDPAIGGALLVEGARTDIEALYPNYPSSYKAGWGYMLLTHFLPSGDGAYTISAVATDVSGKQSVLGTTYITVDNAGAVKPFGAIDTPAAGETASGANYMNYGWVLTPVPNTVPVDGSTIYVFVNYQSQGNPTYDVYRSDIASLFPGYLNSGGAAAYTYLDTTGFANGVYVVYWIATDNAGNADGIGSRFFTIQNSGSTRMQEQSPYRPAYKSMLQPGAVHRMIQGETGPVGVITGFNPEAAPREVLPGEGGIIEVGVKQLDRLELRLGKAREKGARYAGYTLVGDALRPLPMGASLDVDKGIFHWLPMPGFIGDYTLAFFKTSESGAVTVQKIRVSVESKY